MIEIDGMKLEATDINVNLYDEDADVTIDITKEGVGYVTAKVIVHYDLREFGYHWNYSGLDVLSSVDVTDVTADEVSYENSDGNDMKPEEFKSTFNIDPVTYTKLLKQLRDIAEDVAPRYIEEEILNNESFWPEKNEYFTESFLVEGYSPVTVSDTERADAEKKFKFELTNGPEKMVYYSGKGAFPKRVGAFDLENFHKAYDKWFEENSLLDIFKEDGKLLNSGTYGKIKFFDKKIPAISAVLKLWGAQYKNELEFLSDKLDKEKELEALSKLADKRSTETREAERKAVELIEATPEYFELVSRYPEYFKKNIKVEANAVAKYFEELSYRGSTTKEGNTELWLYVGITGVIEDPSIKEISSRANTGTYVNHSFKVTKDNIDKAPTWDIMIADVVDSFKKKLSKLSRVARAALFLNMNFRVFESRPEADLVNVEDNKLNWFGYYSPASGECYKAKLIEFNCTVDSKENKLNGLMLINIKDDTNRATVFTDHFKLVCARYNDYNYDGGVHGTITKASYDNYFDSSVDKALLDKFNIRTASSSGGYSSYVYHDDYTVSEADPPFSKVFDKQGSYDFFSDSSD